jgi:YHS domain-containing protein
LKNQALNKEKAVRKMGSEILFKYSFRLPIFLTLGWGATIKVEGFCIARRSMLCMNDKIMKTLKNLSLICLLSSLALLPLAVSAADAKADAQAEAKPYPLKTCPVSGEKFGGDMGKPYIMAYEGREIKLCCKGCVDDFNKNAASYIKKIDAAEKKAAKDHPYPLNTCLVSGEKMGGSMGKPVSLVYEEQELKFCCKDCIKEFKKDTDKYMKKLASAKKTAK